METKLLEFTIDGEPISLNAEGSPPLKYGQCEMLSNAETDITFGQEWYGTGFKIYPFLEEAEFDCLRAGISECIRNILSGLNVDTENFQLNKYHRFLHNEEQHFNVVAKTRDLFPDDFNFPISEYMELFGKLLGFELTDVNPKNGDKLHIIIRINRPKSKDFNPPHKDIYEDWDDGKYIPKFVNLWVPICGVNSKSSLPLVPGSHLLQEDKVLRTFVGGVIGGSQYRVRNVVRWDGRNDLYRAKIRNGELLVFTSHLVHGCAFNNQDEETRVALEFRLFKK